MSHALNALDHALRGDPSGLSFLEQTASIYVLDATTPGHPTTYGWWDFLNNALTEVERYEEGLFAAINNSNNNYPFNNNYAATNGTNTTANPLDSHVRLLATITRRIARRPPSSDKRLIGTCLSNASMTHLALLSNPETSRMLLQSNEQLRERDMGRIAAIVFDYSFHNTKKKKKNNTNANNAVVHNSAFADPVAMEMMCGVIAANAVSTGPNAVRHLISNWIVPSCESLPSFSVVAILNHVAGETLGKGCPLGVKDVVKECVSEVFVKGLGPLLVEASRESEEGNDESMIDGGGGDNGNHRTAAMTLRAFDSWCKASSTGAVQLRNFFASTKINILEAIADSLYSNSEQVIDAVSDLIDTILKIDSMSNQVSSGLSIAQAVLSSTALGSNSLLLAQQVAADNTKARISILAELVSAVGLQRLRFMERQQKNDIAVCRCLARTAARVLSESKDFITSGAMKIPMNGLVELLFKAIAHPSIDVCGIALEAFSDIAPSNTELSTRLLPYLQGKAILPVQLRNDTERIEEFIDFRDRFLKEALVACYTGCRSYYLTSCASAIEEFCQAAALPHVPHQLEAALFCVVAVSSKAQKSADKQTLNEQLMKITSALKNNAFATTSDRFVMARMCSFINQYASSLAQCDQATVFEMASELVLTSFNLSVAAECNQSMPVTRHVSALSEASNGLQKLLCAAPTRFSAPAAISALETAWNMPYKGSRIAIEDREILCKGLCVVIASLPPGQDVLSKLTHPILSCINVTVKEAQTNTCERRSILQRLANEIQLLASVVKHYVRTDAPERFELLSAMLQKSWPSVAIIVEKYSSEENVAESILQLMKESLSLYRSSGDVILLQEACSLSNTVAAKKRASLPTFLLFVQTVIEMHGSKAEITSNADDNENSTAFRGIIKQLMILSYEGVMTASVVRGQTMSSLPRDSEEVPDVMSAMFKTLSKCMAKCPIFFMSMSRDGQAAGELVLLSVQASPGAISMAEVDVSSSAIHFLDVLVSFVF